VALAEKHRGRRLLEQRLSSYQKNPGFFDTACDGVLAVRRVEARLRQLNELESAAAFPARITHAMDDVVNKLAISDADPPL
jgi:hypothetical protein